VSESECNKKKRLTRSECPLFKKGDKMTILWT
jgi:hypothetical protein